MTSIDDLFRKPNLPSKRKIEPLTNPERVYKSAKISANGDASTSATATVEDATDDNSDDGEEGPSLPPDGEDDYGPEDDEGRFFGSGVDAGTREALDYVDEKDKEPFVPEKINAAWLRKTALGFERRISKNAELRARYEDDPAKFMSSEADLDADVKALSILSEHPELYTDFARLGCVASLVSLLAHDNTDIAIDAIQIISELTDEEVEAEQEQWDAVVDAMLEADLLSLLEQNFGRFDEENEDDASGVYRSLSILENLASKPSIVEQIGKETTVLKWLLGRIQKREPRVSQNKQYAAEVLEILLQSSAPNRNRVLDLDGTDVLLQLLSAYRKYDPEKDSEEAEYAENLFDALTCLVDEPRGKAAFVASEGVELCLIMLRDGKMSKLRALRVLDHAASVSTSPAPAPTLTTADATSPSSPSMNGNPPPPDDPDGATVCDRLVSAAGLKTVFGMFMKRQDAPVYEHLVGLFASLLRALPADSPARIRALAKFVERDYEKAARVVALRRDYAARLARADVQIAEERRERAAGDAGAEEGWFSRRLDAGLFCLRTIDTILAWLVAEDDGARTKIAGLLAEGGEGLGGVRKTLEEQVADMDAEAEGGREQREMLETLISFL